MSKTKASAGFTLIETLMYIALLSIVMVGIIGAVYDIAQGVSAQSRKTSVQDEGNFVVRKLQWALRGMDPSKPITPSSGYESMVSFTKYDGTKIDIRLQGTVIEMRQGGTAGTYRALTTDNVIVSALRFRAIPSIGAGPFGVEASTTISALDSGSIPVVFTATSYIRK